jgi:hypothetical protein
VIDKIKSLISPEFFDIFGLPLFAVILMIGIFQLLNKKRYPNWVWILLIIIGTLGLIVDGTIIGFAVLIKNSVIGG